MPCLYRWMKLGRLLARLPPRTRLYTATALYGLAGGGVAVLFHLSIHAIYHATFESWATRGTLFFALATLGLMLGVALLSGWLVNVRCPAAAGSGIPQLKLAFWKDFGWAAPQIMVLKFVVGSLSVGGGMSLGREGPSVQLAGTMGSWLATRLGLAKQKHRMPAAAGAAAGLAAAFNTPLAAVTFVLEEIIGDLNSRFLGNMLMASLLGALVAHYVLGPQPAFHLSLPDEAGWQVYLLTPWVAAVATLVGVFFQWSSLKIRHWTKTQSTVAVWLLPCLGVLPTWLIGVTVFAKTGHLGVFSLGYADLSEALAGHLTWQIVALLLVTKLAATILCYGFGGCGGIFSPTLFLGAMAGLTAAALAQCLMPLHDADVSVLAVVGMCACMGAAVRAPVTGILIVFEMTHQFALVLPLMLGALVSQAISRRLLPANFYDTILEQDGHHLHRIIPPRDLASWQQLPASTIANFHPVALTDLEPDTLRQAIEQHPFANFPCVQDQRVIGVISRHVIEKALLSGAEVVPLPPSVATPQDSIGVVQDLLIQSETGMAILCDDHGHLLGVVTLHDLVRAQAAYGGGLDK